MYSANLGSYIIGYFGKESFNGFIMSFPDITKTGTTAISEASLIFNMISSAIANDYELDKTYNNKLTITSLDKTTMKIAGIFTVKVVRKNSGPVQDGKYYFVSGSFNQSYTISDLRTGQ